MLRALHMPVAWFSVALITFFSLGATAYGHARREVGPYRLVVGFLVEPAYEGLKNGVDLRVLRADTEAPLERLQDTLQVEVTHVPSMVAKVLKLRSIYRDPGPLYGRPDTDGSRPVSLPLLWHYRGYDSAGDL